MNQLSAQIDQSSECLNMRLDKALPLIFPEHSRSFFDALFDKKLVKVNHRLEKKSYKLQEGDSLLVEVPPSEPLNLSKTQMPLEILYEDEHLLIINKPAGIVVHPAPGHNHDTIVNGILHYCDVETDEDDARPGIVHRLDKDTSGVLITCKTKKAHEAMSKLFHDRQISKSYLAICLGRVKDEHIEASIARHKHFRQKMSVSTADNARWAKTIATCLYYDHEISLAKLDIITGRTHQIRVHMQHKKTPVLGDPVYGYPHANATFKANRQYLHAFSIRFTHPFSGKLLDITAPLAQDMKTFLESRKVDKSLFTP